MAYNQIFVMNSGSLQDHTFADPSAVTAGVIAAFDGAGNFLELDDSLDGGGESAIPDQIQFVLGGTTPSLTQLMDGSELTVVKKAYTAPVAQVTTVSTIPTGTAGTAIVRIEDLSLRPSWERKSYEVAVTASDDATAIVTLLKTAINGDDTSVVTASGTTTLVLTSDDADVSFNTSIDGVLDGATVTATTDPKPGYGTYEHVLQLEKDARGTYSDYYQNNQLLRGAFQEAVPTNASSAETYDVYVISSKNNNDTAINKSFARSELVLAISTNVTGDLDTFFASLL